MSHIDLPPPPPPSTLLAKSGAQSHADNDGERPAKKPKTPDDQVDTPTPTGPAPQPPSAPATPQQQQRGDPMSAMPKPSTSTAQTNGDSTSTSSPAHTSPPPAKSARPPSRRLSPTSIAPSAYAPPTSPESRQNGHGHDHVRGTVPRPLTANSVRSGETGFSTKPQPEAQVVNPEEHQYLDLVRAVFRSGQPRPDRTGTGTISLFAPPSLRFSLADGAFPLLTTKRVFLRGVVEELLWFVKGCTDAKVLSESGVKIWDGNGSKEFLERVGLGHRREGDLGPVYGFQWRHFGAEYVDADTDYTGKGVDQLRECIRKIKEDPTDRRIIMSAWNPADLNKMALPPCHMFCQFYVHLPSASSPSAPMPAPRLSCLMYQRSADLGLGVPFNIASYALLTHMIAQVTGCQPHELIMQLGDAHVYRDHADALGVQLGREPRAFPTLRWARKIDDIDGFKAEDVIIEGYKPYPKIGMNMSV